MKKNVVLLVAIGLLMGSMFDSADAARGRGRGGWRGGRGGWRRGGGRTTVINNLH